MAPKVSKIKNTINTTSNEECSSAVELQVSEAGGVAPQGALGIYHISNL